MKSLKLPQLDPKPRSGELTKGLPVACVVASILGLWYIYVFCHCVPLLTASHTYSNGFWELVIFNVLTVLLLSCYVRCMLQHPGTIPDREASGIESWEYVPQDKKLSEHVLDPLQMSVLEKKRSGERRNCKWCVKYKPDRCHHCRVCRTCVLKMDHHCPWINNCVGFGNYKYFLLLIMYCTISLHFMIWTMLPSVSKAIRNSDDGRNTSSDLFFLLFGEVLAAVLAFGITIFFGFHTWLMLQATTTIEFFEKSKKNASFSGSRYDRGLLGNIRAGLGDNALLWFLPCSPPSGDGLTFLAEESPIRLSSRDLIKRDTKLGQQSDVNNLNLEAALIKLGLARSSLSEAEVFAINTPREVFIGAPRP